MDPFALVADELESVSERLRRTILTEIPVLSTAAEYFFKVGLGSPVKSVDTACDVAIFSDKQGHDHHASCLMLFARQQCPEDLIP